LNEQLLVRSGISAYLDSQPDMVVRGEADSIPGAASKIAECQPQLLVTELRLGAADKPEIGQEAKGRKPSAADPGVLRV
jgi:DNA-binding NarL/FixJ family response regulator